MGELLKSGFALMICCIISVACLVYAIKSQNAIETAILIIISGAAFCGSLIWAVVLND